jgi:F5/8 type C domain-containing protein
VSVARALRVLVVSVLATIAAVSAAAAATATQARATRIATRATARAGGPAIVDAFESTAGWSALPASGVSMTLASDLGAVGRSLRIDFDFHGGGGYAVARKAFDLRLPANYRFSFRVRGECAPQNLEFKLVDSTGANVWWVNTRDYAFTPGWQTVTLKKRHIAFAWGPAGGGEIGRVAAIEFAVTAGQGGRGTVWLDQLTLEPLPVPPANPPAPIARASTAARGHAAAAATDTDTTTFWASAPGDRAPWIELDLGAEREFGGLVVDWMPGRHAIDYAVEAADGPGRWRPLRAVAGGNGGRDPLYLPESEARRVRLRVLRAADQRGVAIRGIAIKPLEWSATPGAFFEAIASEARRGLHPRALRREQTYWTVVGADGAREEALINEEGMLETGKASYSIEPFLYANGKLITWADVRTEQSLADGDLPIPTVSWIGAPLGLSVTAVGVGNSARSDVWVRYRVSNPGATRVRGTLYLALRPFQVNPPTQFLNTPGGVARLRSLNLDGRVVWTNKEHGVVSVTAPTAFGAATFDQGDVTEWLAQDRLPAATSVADSFAHASGALGYALDLPPHGERDIVIVVPMVEWPNAHLPALDDSADVREFGANLERVSHDWRQQLDRVTITLPDSEVTRALRAQIGWILVNRDGAAIQPGSRSYERSWIRDGALTSAALLRLGQGDVVKSYLEWFAAFQYGDGKVPCCVDARGADPVPEHDSHGEFIYLAAEYLRLTGDRATVGRLWPHVRAAAAYLDTLRAQRRTAEWRTPENAPYLGILPPSISHEGYSAKPMHSYWDDLFALRGYKDAAWLARELGKGDDAAWLAASRDTFARDFAASVRAAMAAHTIDYVPGCADLGDFDATSTTIAINPAEAQDVLPRGALERTFERYWEFFDDRRSGRKPWDAFTPYEWRTVGAMARLGWRERADWALTWLMQYRRPPGFQHWAEVVWNDERAPHFIGDMPHTWVGSDFVRSVLDMLAYEREADSALVIGAGIPERWVTERGITVRGLRTRWGTLSYTVRDDGRTRELLISSTDLRIPPGGIVIASPAPGGPTGIVMVGGKPSGGPLVVRSLPARLRWVRRSPDAGARH